jgi:tyrosine-protein kinase Etk/Wzc
LGWNSLVELTQKLNLAKNVQNQLQFEEFIKTLREKIDVGMRQSNMISIAYSSKDPQEAQRVTQTLTDILIKRNLESQTKEADVAIQFIQEQLAIYKRKIKESEISQLEDQLKTLMVDSTEQHPMVKELKQKIASAKKELDSGEYEVSGSDKPVDNATREVLKKELDKVISTGTESNFAPKSSSNETETDTNNSIYKLLLMDKVGTSLARDIDVNKGLYGMLLQRLETAKITQRLETSKVGTRYTILEPARLPLKPTKPNKQKLVLFGMVLGCFAGAGLVFAREFMDHSFLDIEDAKNNLELPVLGGISRITTKEEIRFESQRKKKFIALGIIISIVFISSSFLFSLFRKV